MDNKQLKKYLLEQNMPIEQAVEKKIAYLQSDDAFVEPFSDWNVPSSNVAKSAEDLSFEEAFGVVQTAKPVVRPGAPKVSPQMPASSTEAPEQPAANAPMTMAQRIAALRGAVSVAQSVAAMRK